MASAARTLERTALPADVVLATRDLSVSYVTRRGLVRAVREVSLDLRKGETLAIIGESGCGKSTLAASLIRLLPRAARIDGGRVLYQKDGLVTDVTALPEDDLREYRWGECALVFQGALNAFNPVLSIWEHFVDTARAHGRQGKELAGSTRELMRLVRLDADRVMNAYPHELSGGMKQRVLIALALLLGPAVVVLDEPTTALDILTQRSIIDLLRALRDELRFSMVFISHDLSVAAELADRVVTMYAGRIVEDGSVGDLFYRPRHPYTLGLLRAVPRVTGAFTQLSSIAGSPPDLMRLPKGCSYHPRCPYARDECLAADPPLLAVDAPRHTAACIRWQAVAADERERS